MSFCRFPLTVISKEEARRYAGMAGTSGEEFQFPEERLLAACQEGLLYAEGKALWKTFPYDPERSAVGTDPVIILEGRDIVAHLAGAESVVIMTATIGQALERAVEEHFAAGRYVQGMLLDAAGTAAVEAVADQANRYIEEEGARRGYRATWRFSPGYGDWPLTVQPALLAAVEAGKLPVSVTEGLMLNPQKSVTAIIGLVPRTVASNKKTDIVCQRGCTACPKKDCLARKES
ncbi:conserved hypothetical protein [Heliomicrobium modesticaldum Ice1]|uniref:Uncharacterized protein n=1 Tax=Heliobacterium modesticaldum (strain ATCC 51547 / Ice1) TaxID=498761 RepID=B0TAJ6_HELMI|nr:hypothetical protein [Heliomicrobium modesticaldum]ABZ85046.1 conserved hypothetical protein [Heliomicrobium modesticaldum Ice1]